MERNIPHYDLELDETRDDLGVYNIAIVPRGAMEKIMIALEEQKKVISVSLDKVNKQYLHCVIMSPDKIIDRNDNGLDYTVSFSEKVIKQTSEKFNKDGNHKNIKLNHKNGTFIDGVLVENWNVIDDKLDKAVALGLDIKKGDWVGTVKVNDPNLLTEDFLNNYSGWSIEGDFIPVLRQQVKLELEKQKQNENKMGIFNKIKTLFGIKVELIEFALKEGKKILVDENTAEVFYIMEDGSRGEKLVDGEYELEDGRMLIVKDGMFSDFKEVEVISTEMSALQAKYNELEVKLALIEKEKADAELAKVELEKVELAKQEDAKKVELEAKVKELESKIVELSKQDAPIVKNVKEELTAMEQHLKDEADNRNEMLANLMKHKNKTK